MRFTYLNCNLYIIQCTDEEFAEHEPTSVEDRLCVPLTECSESEYEISAPSEDSDRQCTKVTECDDARGTCLPPSPPQWNVIESLAQTRPDRASRVDVSTRGDGRPPTRLQIPHREAEVRDQALGLSQFRGRHLLEILLAQYLRIGERHPDRVLGLFPQVPLQPSLGVQRVQHPSVRMARSSLGRKAAEREQFLQDAIHSAVRLAPEEPERLAIHVPVLAPFHPSGM